MKIIRASKRLWGREGWQGYLYISPWLFGFFVFGLIPMVVSAYVSFVKWDFIRPPVWKGLDNYKYILQSPTFLLALKNTVVYTLCSTIVTIVFGLLTAIALSKDSKQSYAFRAIIYLPSLVIGLAFAMMMRPVFGGGEFGLINQIFHLVGLPEQNWLGNPNQAVWVMVTMSLWGIGGSMIIFLAGIKGIDRSYYESAMIDGAGAISMFFRITVPLLTPVITFQLVMGIIWGLQVFDLPLGLVGASSGIGMGSGNSLATLVFYLYITGFKNFNMGEAAAIGWLIFLLTLVITLIIFRMSRRYKFFGE